MAPKSSSANTSAAATPTPTTTTAASLQPAETLLRRAHSPARASQIFTDKIQHKSLFLAPGANATGQSGTSDSRALRRHVRLRRQAYALRKRRPAPLSAREKRETGVHKLRKEEIRYEIYKGLNEVWNGYMLEILGIMRDGVPVEGWERREVGVAGQGAVLAGADFHGAEVEVVRCRDAGKVGFRGVVVRDTKFTFVIVMPGDRVRTVAKKGAVFAYEVRLPGGRKVKLEANGDALEYRPAERATRKFKWKHFDV